MSSPVRIVFLGGLGEIGRNCFCLEVEDRCREVYARLNA